MLTVQRGRTLDAYTKQIAALVSVTGMAIAAGVLAAVSQRLLLVMGVALLLGSLILVSLTSAFWGIVIYVASLCLLPKSLGLPLLPGLSSTLTPSRLLLIVAMLPWFSNLLRGRSRLNRSPFDIFILVAVVSALLTTPFSHAPSTSILRLGGELLDWFLVFFFVFHQVNGRLFIERLLTASSILVMVICVLALVEFATRLNVYRDVILASLGSVSWDWLADYRLQGVGFYRVSGAFEHPIALGIFLVLWFPVVLAMAIIKRGVHRLWFVIVSGASLVSIGLALSRTAWIALSIGMLVMFVSLRRQRSVVMMAVSMIALLLLATLPIFRSDNGMILSPIDVLTSSFNISIGDNEQGLQTSMLGRTYVFANSLNAIRKSPWAGIGWGVTRGNSPDRGELGLGGMENEYLRYLVEGGILAGVFRIILMFAVLWMAWRGQKEARDRDSYWIALGLCSGLVAYAVSLSGVGSYAQRLDPMFWLCVALSAWLLRNHNAESGSESGKTNQRVEA